MLSGVVKVDLKKVLPSKVVFIVSRKIWCPCSQESCRHSKQSLCLCPQKLRVLAGAQVAIGIPWQSLHSLFDIRNDNGWDADLKVLLSDISLRPLLDRLLQNSFLKFAPLTKEGLELTFDYRSLFD